MNMMEVPDVLPWVRAKEVLVTSGYPLQEFSEQGLIELLEGLKVAGVSALIVKIGGRYLRGLAATVARRADELGLPVIAMPLDLAFTDLQETFFAEVVARHRQALLTHERTREYGEALRQLVNERSSASESDLREVVQGLHTTVATSVHVCILRADGPWNLQKYQDVAHRLASVLPHGRHSTLSFPYADHIVLVVPSELMEDVEEALAATLRSLARGDGTGAGGLRCGVGNRADSLVDWRRSFGQAVLALQVTHDDPVEGRAPIVRFSRTGIHRAIDALRAAGIAEDFVDQALSAVRDKPDLVDTLHVLLRHNCVIAETAATMNFHYNTIRNRIARLEELLGPFLESGHRRAELLLACELVARGVSARRTAVL